MSIDLRDLSGRCLFHRGAKHRDERLYARIFHRGAKRRDERPDQKGFDERLRDQKGLCDNKHCHTKISIQ